MIPDGEYTAVVDEVEESLARLELGDDGKWYDLVVGTGELPDQARRVDAVLTVTVAEDTLVDAAYRPDETAQRRENTQDRFDRLSRRPPGSDDDADGADDG